MKTPSFTRGEYWILETVVEGGFPLCWLGSKNIEELYNKPGHRLDRGELVNTLESLFRRGLIGVGDLSDGKGSECPIEDALDRTAIESTLKETNIWEWTHYGLTAEGGRQWEAFAQPDWDAYIQPEMGGRLYRKLRPGSFTSATLRRVQKLVENAHHVGIFVDLNTIRWRLIRPWRATYWKELTEGH